MCAFQSGDKTAFRLLLARHQKPLFGFLLRFLKTYENAEEAFQEVFLRVVKSQKDYKPTAKFTTWLYTLARHYCIDFMRKEKFRQHQSIDQDAGESSGHSRFEKYLSNPESLESITEGKELQDHLMAVLDGLSPEQKTVFLLREFQNLPFDEIAKITQVPVNTVKSRMRYAVQAIQTGLGKRGILARP